MEHDELIDSYVFRADDVLLAIHAFEVWSVGIPFSMMYGMTRESVPDWPLKPHYTAVTTVSNKGLCYYVSSLD